MQACGIVPATSRTENRSPINLGYPTIVLFIGFTSCMLDITNKPGYKYRIDSKGGTLGPLPSFGPAIFTG